MRRYDSLVIGGGMSGLPLALRAARHGSVAFVEREQLGGTCLNRGCIPTKTMIASAKVASQLRRASEFGVYADGARVDLGVVVDRKDGVVADIRKGSYRAVERAGDLDFYEGHGRFVAPRRLRVDGSEFEADRIFLNTGTRDARPPIDGLDGVPVLTSRSMLELRELPEHLVVIGGGFIGCEFAQMYRRFGSRVTVVQRSDRLLPGEEPDVSATVREAFEAEGIDVLTSTECVAVEGTQGDIRVGCAGDQPSAVHGTHVLIAAGRTPNTDQLDLEHVGLEADEGGYLRVDGRLHTGVDDVWALGDLRGRDMFTHTARDDAEVVYRTVFGGEDQTIDDRIVPHAVFVDPEVGSVGPTEHAARADGYEVSIGVQEFSGVAKARAMGETRGFVKFVADAETDRILGCHVVGPEAGNLVHEAVVAMVAGATYGDIGRAIHIHPTLAEGMNSAAGGVHRPSTD